MTWADPVNFTGLQSMFTYVEVQSGGWLSLFFALSMFIIIFVTIKFGGQRTSVSFTLASFVSFIISAIFYGAKVMAGKIVVGLFVMLILSISYTYLAER